MDNNTPQVFLVPTQDIFRRLVIVVRRPNSNKVRNCHAGECALIRVASALVRKVCRDRGDAHIAPESEGPSPDCVDGLGSEAERHVLVGRLRDPQDGEGRDEVLSGMTWVKDCKL